MRADEAEPADGLPHSDTHAPSHREETGRSPATDEPPTDTPDRTPHQPIDSRPTRPLDSEETEVLRIDPATPNPAPATDPPAFRDPATHQDPRWRPGLLPRAPEEGRLIPDTASTPGTSPRPATPDNRRPRRTFDPMSMVAGVFFMGIAVTYLLDAGNAVDARPGIMLALAVIGVGASGFLGALWSLLTRPRRPTKTPPTTD